MNRRVRFRRVRVKAFRSTVSSAVLPFRAMRRRSYLLAIGLIMAAGLAVEAEHWPQFRGSRGGVAPDDPALPDTWSATQNVAWKVDIPGRSWSSPVVWGEHVFVTTAIDTAGDKPLRPTSEYISRSGGGTMTFQDLETAKTPLRWMVYDIDLKTGKVRWEREAATGVQIGRASRRGRQ